MWVSRIAAGRASPNSDAAAVRVAVVLRAHAVSISSTLWASIAGVADVLGRDGGGAVARLPSLPAHDSSGEGVRKMRIATSVFVAAHDRVQHLVHEQLDSLRLGPAQAAAEHC